MKPAHAPRTKRQDTPNGNFLLLWHVQTPQHHHGHEDQHSIGGDVQHGLCERDVVETGAAANIERITRP